MALSRKDGLVVVKNTISNTEVNLIYITEDKLENILIKHESKMKKSRDWASALGFSVSSIAAFFASGFHNLSAMDIVIKTVFGGLSLFSFGYLYYTVRNFRINRDSVDNIIQDIKKGKTSS